MGPHLSLPNSHLGSVWTKGKHRANIEAKGGSVFGRKHSPGVG